MRVKYSELLKRESQQRYELKYSDGGHGGPYFGMQASQEAAMAHLNGMPPALKQSVTVVPYASGTCTSDGYEQVDCVYIERRVHRCTCAICPHEGQPYFRIRTFKGDAF